MKNKLTAPRRNPTLRAMTIEQMRSLSNPAPYVISLLKKYDSLQSSPLTKSEIKHYKALIWNTQSYHHFQTFTLRGKTYRYYPFSTETINSQTYPKWIILNPHRSGYYLSRDPLYPSILYPHDLTSGAPSAVNSCLLFHEIKIKKTLTLIPGN